MKNPFKNIFNKVSTGKVVEPTKRNEHITSQVEEMSKLQGEGNYKYIKFCRPNTKALYFDKINTLFLGENEELLVNIGAVKLYNVINSYANIYFNKTEYEEMAEFITYLKESLGSDEFNAREKIRKSNLWDVSIIDMQDILNFYKDEYLKFICSKFIIKIVHEFDVDFYHYLKDTTSHKKLEFNEKIRELLDMSIIEYYPSNYLKYKKQKPKTSIINNNQWKCFSKENPNYGDMIVISHPLEQTIGYKPFITIYSRDTEVFDSSLWFKLPPCQPTVLNYKVNWNKTPQIIVDRNNYNVLLLIKSPTPIGYATGEPGVAILLTKPPFKNNRHLIIGDKIIIENRDTLNDRYILPPKPVKLTNKLIKLLMY